MERRDADGPGRPPGRHRSPEKPPAAGRGRYLTAAVVAVVLVGGSLVGWALLNESPPEPRAAGCAPDCAVPETTRPSSPSQRPSAPVASDSVPSPTPPTSPEETPTTEASATPDRDDDDRWRGRGRGDGDDDDRWGREGGLRTDFSTRGDWGSNFIGAVTVTNRGGRSVEAGNLVFGYGRGVRITSAWGVPSEWSGGNVVARLGVLPPGASATVTFQAAGDASSPDHCSLDGRRCG
ncbi:cellulose binding domain-containing protein [Actinomadura sp. LOL_016]|uniref:cellulose binding domain-containing protein n=1 Tax=unclassified Actinomadura TaxID=2626254 RepID=UPI003A8043C8